MHFRSLMNKEKMVKNVTLITKMNMILLFERGTIQNKKIEDNTICYSYALIVDKSTIDIKDMIVEK